MCCKTSPADATEDASSAAWSGRAADSVWQRATPNLEQWLKLFGTQTCQYLKPSSTSAQRYTLSRLNAPAQTLLHAWFFGEHRCPFLGCLSPQAANSASELPWHRPLRQFLQIPPSRPTPTTSPTTHTVRWRSPQSRRWFCSMTTT